MPRRCRVANSTCSRGSAKCRPRGASSSKNSRRASANTASPSTSSADWDYPPYEAIIRKSQRLSADLLVVENHHGTGRHPARWLLAYTDWELLRLCPIPVLLVKNRRLYHRPRVLAAVDPSHAFAKPSNLDRQILRAGAQLVHALHGELHALHVFHPGVPVVPAMPDGPMMDVAAERDTRTRRRGASSNAPSTDST